MRSRLTTPGLRAATWLALSGLLIPGLPACKGEDGQDGATEVPPTPDELAPGDATPGLVVEVLGVSGASGAAGSFRPGDRLTVHFEMRKDDGSPWRAEEIDTARILVSGPTFNYQRVLEEQSDLISAARVHGDGSFSYTFAAPIPATYLPPLNDTPSFGPLDGELAGQPLLAGTYTVGIYAGWDYTVDGLHFREVGDAVFDFLIGSTAGLQPRSLVSQENCNQCHTTLQAHDGLRRNVTLCLLCHTAGAEDRNDAGVAGGTPGTTIAFEVMIHKIHNGEHLPSVQGVGTLADGTRDYTVPSQPYQVVGCRNSIHDYSEVAFPAWPNLNIAMPRDAGYGALGPDERAKEDAVRTGVTSCFVCHGDPDGSGPLTEPAQGPVAYSQPSRGACGSCHDDVDWNLPYWSNAASDAARMPPQADDSACIQCHAPAGDELAVRDAHRHPLLDPSFATGLNVELLSIDEAGANDGDGTLDPGETLALTFRLLDDSGGEVAPGGLNMSVAVSGPTENLNLLHYASFPSAKLTGSQPFTTALPERIWFESVGVAGAGLDVLATERFPHWNVAGALTEVRAGTVDVLGGVSMLATAVTGPINWIDVQNPTGFARDDMIVIDRGMAGEEVLLVRHVEGNRLWFASPYTTGENPGPVRAHRLHAPVEELSLATVASDDYSLDAAAGTVTEAGAGFVDGDLIVISYTADFMVPARFPVALNGSPDRDALQGSWSGLELVDGTYTLGLWANRSLPLPLHGESNSYRETSPGVRMDFLVGSAGQLAPYDLISSAANCYACHQDMWFHGAGRRGFDTCILCHGTAGAEDRPTYVAAAAPATTGLTVNFRTMLHKIHRGADLANADGYQVVGFGSSPYPDNYGLSSFAEVHFPAMPDGVKECAKCHGSSDAWRQPAAREHGDEPARTAQVWTATCGACHDSDAAQDHIALQTTPDGRESCATCHSEDDDLGVPLVHRVR